MKRLLLSAAFVTAALSGGSAYAACGDITLAVFSWQSAEAMSNVDKFILNNGYGCNASVIAGDGWLAEVLTKPVLLRPADRRFDNVPSGCAALAVVADGTVAATASMSRFTGGALVPTVLRSVERTHPGGAR